MGDERSRVGLMVSALGAVVLMIAVFLPWYGLSFTAAGIAAAQQASQQVIAEFGNSTLQSTAGALHSSLGGLVGHQVAAVSAHQAFKDMSVVLIVLGGLALLDVLLALARPTSSVPSGAGASAVLLGVVAVACVLFRMIDRPQSFGAYVSLALREGIWLALIGSLAMIAGGMWPKAASSPANVEAKLEDTWSALSGWTPGT